MEWTFFTGISCPRPARPGPAGQSIDEEPYGNEALQFVKDICLQREAQLEVETMDKVGNFVGWMFFEGANVAQLLGKFEK